MGITFVSASSQVLARSGASITTYPFSVSVLAKPTSIGLRMGVWGSGVSGSADNFFRLDITAAGAIQARARTTAVSDATGAGTLSAGTVYQLGYLGTSATSRQAVQDGVLSTANTTSRAPAGMNRTTIGAVPDNSGTFSDLTVYYAAEWDTTLTQADWDMLADRIHPLLVKPANLVSLWMPNGLSTEIDLVGRNELTPTNSPTKANNDAILYLPRGRWGGAASPAAVGGGTWAPGLTLMGVG